MNPNRDELEAAHRRIDALEAELRAVNQPSESTPHVAGPRQSAPRAVLRVFARLLARHVAVLLGAVSIALIGTSAVGLWIFAAAFVGHSECAPRDALCAALAPTLYPLRWLIVLGPFVAALGVGVVWTWREAKKRVRNEDGT